MPLSILVLLVIEKKTGGEKIKVGSEWPRTVLTLRCSAGGSVCGGGGTTWAQTAGSAADCLSLLRTGGLHNRRR